MLSLLRFLADAWLLLLPLALGFVALWALMPPARQGKVFASTVLGLFALVLAGFVLPQATGVRTPLAFDVLFWLFAGLAVGGGATMIVQRNPVYAALWFAVVVLSVCGLFLLHSAPFLAAATIIIYAGAIIVTFLFVIMLAQQAGLAEYDRRSREPVLSLLAGFLLLGGLLWTLQLSYAWSPRLEKVQERLKNAAIFSDPNAAAKDVADFLKIGDDNVDLILLEETNKLPPWERQQPIRAELSALGAKVGQAVQKQDKATLLAALTEYLNLAEEIESARHRLTGMVPVPPEREKELSHLADRSKDGKYVLGLGRTLFGEYLYAVAASGVLLLVATIGAIVIAQRQPGESA